MAIHFREKTWFCSSCWCSKNYFWQKFVRLWNILVIWPFKCVCKLTQFVCFSPVWRCSFRIFCFVLFDWIQQNWRSFFSIVLLRFYFFRVRILTLISSRNCLVKFSQTLQPRRYKWRFIFSMFNAFKKRTDSSVFPTKFRLLRIFLFCIKTATLVFCHFKTVYSRITVVNFFLNKIYHSMGVKISVASFFSHIRYKKVTDQLENNLCKLIDFFSFLMNLLFDEVVNFIHFAGILHSIIRAIVKHHYWRRVKWNVFLIWYRRKKLIFFLIPCY